MIRYFLQGFFFLQRVLHFCDWCFFARFFSEVFFVFFATGGCFFSMDFALVCLRIFFFEKIVFASFFSQWVLCFCASDFVFLCKGFLFFFCRRFGVFVSRSLCFFFLQEMLCFFGWKVFFKVFFFLDMVCFHFKGVFFSNVFFFFQRVVSFFKGRIFSRIFLKVFFLSRKKFKKSEDFTKKKAFLTKVFGPFFLHRLLFSEK